ncbi:MAG: hypothetical protein NE334_05745 [Lentisphaeraceae bacterium]|nr:hypothetical protein [Lentisphaeraceae bacterium]
MFVRAILIFSLFLMTGCHERPSETDVGRVKEKDGFKVKSFMKLTSQKPDKEVKLAIRDAMKEHSLSKRSTTTINKTSKMYYFNFDSSKMVQINRKNNKVTDVVVEGPMEFLNAITKKIVNKESFEASKLENAKKTFADDHEKLEVQIKLIAKAYELEHSLASFVFRDNVNLGFEKNNRRLSLEGTSDYMIVMIEGEKGFVSEVREEVNSLMSK